MLTRRQLFITGGASFCAPAIVRPASLMHVRDVPLERPQAGLCERLMYSMLDRDLREGQMRTTLNGATIPEAEACRMVACARMHGWLPPG